MKHIFRTLSICVLPLLIAACNTDYNFDNISLEVTVGDTDGIAVPLGNTGTITLGDLLKEAGLETNEDGFYGFSYGDNFEYTAEVEALPSITGLIPTIAPITNSLLGGFSASIAPFNEEKTLAFPSGLSGNYTITDAMLSYLNKFPLQYDPETFEQSFTIGLPAEVQSLEQVTFGANGQGSLMEMQFNLGGLANVNDRCEIGTLSFELPAGFTLATLPGDPIADHITISNGTGSSTPNHFEIKNYNFTGNTLTIDIILKSVNLEHATISNNEVTITENVTFELDATLYAKAGTVSTTAPSMRISLTPEIYDATIVVNEIAHSMSFEEHIEQEIAIPDIVSRIDYLTIGKVGNPDESPQFSVALELSGAPMDKIELRDVEITLPEFLDIDAPSGWTYNNGTLSCPVVEVHNNQNNAIIDLVLKGIKGLDIVNNNISLDSKIGLSATAAIAGGETLHITTAEKVLTLTPIVTLDDMTIKEVSGIINPDLSDMLPTQEIELGDFTSSLEGIDMNLNIASPVLSLTVENPIGVGIDAIVTLTAYKGGEVVKTITTPTLSIIPAQGSTPTTTHIIINGDAAPDSPDYQLIQLDGFADMVAALPEKIVVELAAETNKDTVHTLTLQDSYTFKVEYAVDAAFKFDSQSNGTINYEVMVEDVDLAALADLNIGVESLILKVASESTLPIDLTLDVELLDENDNAIECVTSTTTGKIAGSTTNEANISSCDITINIATPTADSSKPSPWAEIARTKKIRCNLQGTTLAGGGLKPDQYISAELSLLLDKGITIDLGGLLSPESADE